MDILLVGFGSIGRRHFEVLNEIDAVKNIHLVTKQVIEGAVCFSSLQEVDCIEGYDYYIICSETAKHYDQLMYIASKVNSKKILVEKPLYDKYHAEAVLNNTVYIAYNLRFHPVLVKLKQMLGNEDIYSANIVCGQYLPTWRPQQDYRKSYSADLKLGGGVLRDLSHELDYMMWLFGTVKNFQYISTKCSDLEIQSDDIFTAIGIASSNAIVTVTMDYISKHPIRRLLIHTKSKTIEADVINNVIKVYDKFGKVEEVVLSAIDRNATYDSMHRAILSSADDNVCSFAEGLEVMAMIQAVDFKEL